MAYTEYTVLADFDESQDYHIHIRPQFRKILQSLSKDQVTTPVDFIKNNVGKFGSTQTKDITADAVYKAFTLGCKIRMLQKGKKAKIATGRTYAEFIAQESVAYWMGQLRGSRYKNLNGKNTTNSTQYQYTKEARCFDASPFLSFS